MTEEDKFAFFAPIIVASLTNAVYTCQLKNSDLNPEQAISDVLLTWQRVSEVLFGQIGKSASRDKKLADMILSELQRVQSRLSDLSMQSPRPGLWEETNFLNQQVSFFVQFSSFLTNS
jgi:hypothetical protein